MASIRDIKRRIRGVENIQQITRAMKMVAGARLKRAQDRLVAMRPYARHTAALAHHVMRYADTHTIPLLSPPATDAPPSIVLFSSDRGLCGAFNGNLIRACTKVLGETARTGREASLSVVGHKGYAFFRRRIARKRIEKVKLQAWSEVSALSSPGAFSRIAGNIEREIAAGKSSGLVVIYALFRSVMKQEVVVRKLVPLEADEIRPLLDNVEPDEEWHPETEPEEQELVRAVFTRFLAAQLYRAAVENWTSELGARMTAMDAATRNAEELTDRLTLDYNKARQAAITREIVDITGGAEALRQL